MISPRLLALVRCPDCRGALDGEPPALRCGGCGRRFTASDDGYLDLRPVRAFEERTKFLDPSLHTDGRHQMVSPPLLTAAIRNRMLRRFLELGPDDRAVDLGCGSGRVLVWNRDLGAHLIGLDVSPYFAQEARADVDLLMGDVRQLPFASGALTKAYSLDVLEHLSRDGLHTMLRETARVLGPGGAFFVYTHVRKNSPIALGLRGIHWLAARLERLGWLDQSLERLRCSDHHNPLADIADLHAVAKATGFRVARLRYFTPLVSGFLENIAVPMAEHALARRARARAGAASGAAAIADATREARLAAKARIARRGPLYVVLTGLTWLAMLDMVLFGRIRSGPFFALLVKE